MLIDSSLQITGDARINYRISGVGHYIDVVLLIHGYIILEIEIASSLALLAKTGRACLCKPSLTVIAVSQSPEPKAKGRRRGNLVTILHTNPAIPCSLY